MFVALLQGFNAAVDDDFKLRIIRF
ncbi:uncharacterized protein METZ01_LOCUS298204 [marine metagenome]|uniref:Uncharacterized protein n=1 Tax=marine metagenome TaxID=408172 RepID=A0A382M9L6_9ZZZZ